MPSARRSGYRRWHLLLEPKIQSCPSSIFSLCPGVYRANFFNFSGGVCRKSKVYVEHDSTKIKIGILVCQSILRELDLRVRLKPIELQVYNPLSDLVFDRLRQSILNGNFKPGQRLVERTLARELGTSRTPVREALRKLELEGLVTRHSRQGLVVSTMSMKEMLDLFTIRTVLEGLAVQLAATHITSTGIRRLQRLMEQMEECTKNNDIDKLDSLHTKFHESLYRAASSSHLYQMLSTLREHISRMTRVGYAASGRLKEAAEEHRKIVEAVSGHKIEEAGVLAKQHIENSKAAFIQAYRELEEKNPKTNRIDQLGGGIDG